MFFGEINPMRAGHVRGPRKGEPVPKFSVAMPGRDLKASSITFSVKEDGILLPPVEIDYKNTLGWDTGDPRIVALNMIAQLTSTPELVRRVTLVAAKTIEKEQVEKLSITGLFQRVLTEDSFQTVEAVLESKFLTATFMDHLGLQRNFLRAFSIIAGTGNDNNSFSTRVEALQAIDNLIRLRGSILKVGIDAFMGGTMYVPTNLEAVKRQQEISPGLRTKLTNLCQDTILRFRSAEESLQMLGIIYTYSMDDSGIIYSVLQEINSGNMNLVDDEQRSLTDRWRESSDFRYLNDEGKSVLRTPGDRDTKQFSGWKSKEIVFSDGSVVRTRNNAVKCPFPHFARK